jgi:hypothetical protein
MRAFVGVSIWKNKSMLMGVNKNNNLKRGQKIDPFKYRR